MRFEITNKEWYRAFDTFAKDARQQSLIISPFLGKTVIERLLGDSPKLVKVITRFNLRDIANGASDIRALEFLLSVGAQVRGIKNLHSKVYVFGSNKAVIASANLTHSGLFRNYEYGVQSGDPEFVRSAMEYFDNLWVKSEPSLTEEQIRSWESILSSSRPSQRSGQGLGDFGADLGISQGEAGESLSLSKLPPWRWFVKFVGTSRNNDRLPLSSLVRTVINNDDTSTRVWYPKNKRPLKVADGDLVFIGRLVKPQDIRIYGRARTFKYVPGQDEATEQEIKIQAWKKDWPHYVRLSDPEFIDGSLEDCVSLYEMINELGTDIFQTTRDRSLKGEKDIHIKGAYGRQPAVWLTSRAGEVLNKRLDDKFNELGVIRN